MIVIRRWRHMTGHFEATTPYAGLEKPCSAYRSGTRRDHAFGGAECAHLRRECAGRHLPEWYDSLRRGSRDRTRTQRLDMAVAGRGHAGGLAAHGAGPVPDV